MRLPWLLSPLVLMLLSGGALRSADHPANAADLIRMHRGGLKGDTILDFLRTYQVSLTLSESDHLELGRAGLSPDTLQALRHYGQTRSTSRPPGGGTEAPLPRFFVGYPHDASAFPAWYYGPFHADSPTSSQQPGQIRGHSHSGRMSARWGRRP